MRGEILGTKDNVLFKDKTFIFLIALLYLNGEAESSDTVIRAISIKFGEALHVCQKELSLPEEVYDDFYNFWKPSYELQHRETGCAIHCLASKLSLVDPDGNLHHGNAHEFAKKHGADDGMAQQLMDLIHNCEKSTPANNDICVKMLDLSKCVKAEVHKLNWAPNMDVVMAEVIAES